MFLRILTGAGRDGVYVVNLKLIARGNWRNVGVIGYQIGRKIEMKRIFKSHTNLALWSDPLVSTRTGETGKLSSWAEELRAGLRIWFST